MTNEKQSYAKRMLISDVGFDQLGQIPDVGRGLVKSVAYVPPMNTKTLSNGSKVDKVANIIASQNVVAKNPCVFSKVTKPVVDGKFITLLSSDIPEVDGDYVLNDAYLQGFGIVKMSKLFLGDTCVAQFAYGPYNKEENVSFVASVYSSYLLNPKQLTFRIELELAEVTDKPTATLNTVVTFVNDVCALASRLMLAHKPRGLAEEAEKKRMIADHDNRQIDVSAVGLTLKTSFYEPIKLTISEDGKTMTYTADVDYKTFAGILVYNKELFARKINSVTFLDSQVPGYLCKICDNAKEMSIINFFHVIKGDILNVTNCSVLPILAGEQVEFDMEAPATPSGLREVDGFLLTYRIYNINHKGAVRIA